MRVMPMARSELLRLDDARAVLRLVNECRDLGADADAWRQRLVDVLRPLLGARLCTIGEFGGTRSNRRQELRGYFTAGMDSEVAAVFQAYMADGMPLRDPIAVRMANSPAPHSTGGAALGRTRARMASLRRFQRILPRRPLPPRPLFQSRLARLGRPIRPGGFSSSRCASIQSARTDS